MSGEPELENALPVLALDPGKDKCGIAIVSLKNTQPIVLLRQIVPAGDVQAVLPVLIDQWRIKQIVLGDATTSRAWRESLSTLLPQAKIILVEEAGSTLEARAKYWKTNPPRGWRRILPLSLQVPPEPIDDFAAEVLAERFFRKAP